MKRNLLSLLMVLLTAISVFAQGKVTGKVTDGGGRTSHRSKCPG